MAGAPVLAQLLALAVLLDSAATLWHGPKNSSVAPRVSLAHGRTTLRRGNATACQGPPENDSAVVVGPDCGNVQQIFGKYQRATEVGELAGTAHGVVAAADSAAQEAEAAASRAFEIGEFAGTNGTVPLSVQLASDAAKAAAANATSASATLATALTTFKDKLGTSAMSGAAVEEIDMVNLKSLMEAARVATKAAQAAAARALEKAEAAQGAALESTHGTAMALKQLIGAANPKLEQSLEVAQKAKWATEDASETVTEAQAVVSSVDSKIAGAGNQTAILDAMKAEVESRAAGVTAASENVSAVVIDLLAAADKLAELVEELEAATQKADGGFTIPSMTTEITATEAAIDNVDKGLSAVAAKSETLEGRENKLKAKFNEVEKAIAK